MGGANAALGVFLLFWDLVLPRVALGALMLQVRALCNALYCVIVGYTWSGRRVVVGGAGVVHCTVSGTHARHQKLLCQLLSLVFVYTINFNLFLIDSSFLFLFP